MANTCMIILLEYFQPTKKKEFLDEINTKKTKISIHDCEHRSREKTGMHWWSFLDTDERNTIFFNSFGSYGLLHFIMTNDMDIFKKTFTGPVETTIQRR